MVRFIILCESSQTSDVTSRPHFERCIIVTITWPYENADIWTCNIFTSFHVLIYLLLATLGTFSNTRLKQVFVQHWPHHNTASHPHRQRYRHSKVLQYESLNFSFKPPKRSKRMKTVHNKSHWAQPCWILSRTEPRSPRVQPSRRVRRPSKRGVFVRVARQRPRTSETDG